MSATRSFPQIPQKEDYIVVCSTVENAIKIDVIGCKTKAVIAEFTVLPNFVRAFLGAIPTLFDSNKCKAIIFDIYKFEPVDPECPHVIKFCFQIRAKLDEMHIKHFFYADRSLFLSALLIQAKINPSKSDSTMFLLVQKENMVVLEYVFTDNGYQKTQKDTVTVPAKSNSWVEIREKILAGSKPKNIIVCGIDMDLPIMKTLKKNIFPKEKLIIFEKKTVSSNSVEHSLKISDYVRDHASNKFHVIPTCPRNLKVNIIDDTNIATQILQINIGTSLPYEYIHMFSRDGKIFQIIEVDENGENEKVIHETKKTENNRHRSKVTVYIDQESLPLLIVRPVILDLIHELPPRLDKLLTKKVPVIVFCDNFSVICAIKNCDTEYSYLEGWGGVFGRDATLFINDGQLQYGWEAKELKEDLPESGVYDLIALMSKEFKAINLEKLPALAKDPEAQLREFMTKLLEEHLGVIREATGQPVEEVAFWLLLPSVEERDARFKKRLIECLLKLGIVSHLLKLEIPQ